MENVSPIIAPDRSLVLTHLGFLFGRALSGKIEITAIHADKNAHHSPRTRFFAVDNFDGAADFACATNAEPGWNVYVGAALRNEDVFPGKAADDDDFLRTYALWADADDGEQLAKAREIYRAQNITPPFVIVTGRTPSKRAQLWWPMEPPIDDIATLRASLRGIATVLGTDPKVCTGKQLMRLGGGVNWPKKEDRILERTEVVEVARAAREFSIEQMHRVFSPLERADLNAAGISDVEIAHGGALGLEERVMDGREGWAFRYLRARLREYVGTTGCEPTPQDLYEFTAPHYFKRVDQVRSGRGAEFLKIKCVEAIRSYHAGQIPGMASLDDAVLSWANRQAADASFEESDVADLGENLFEVLSMSDIKALPEAEWLVEDVIPKCSLGFLYGAPGSYKTFLCYDLALTLAYGLDTWLDKPIKHAGSVLYIAAEGSSGFKNRITAWQRKRGYTEESEQFRLIRKSMSFMNAKDIDRLERTVAAIVERYGPVDTVFVDTVSRVLPGADENLQKDMTIFIAACDRIRERFGCAVVGVHHTNKNGEMRGSTIFAGQGDFIFRVDKNDSHTGGLLTCEKEKDAEDGWRKSFAVEKLEWMIPGRLKEASSLVVSFTDLAVVEAQESSWPSRDVCRAILQAIDQAWINGRPWSMHKQSSREGKYAIRNICEALALKAPAVEMVLETWLANEMIVVEVADTKTHKRGLKVMKWLD